MRVILASASPRRRELLKQLVEEFEVIPADVDEEAYAETHWHTVAKELSQLKAKAVWKNNQDAVVIGADTEVILEVSPLRAEISKLGADPAEALFRRRWPMGKPKDVEDARRMLRLLSHRRHFVSTGVCVLTPDWSETFVEISAVRFRKLSEHEIADYVATGEPMDKAGAYAIQGGARDFVVRVDGSISNVIGLPLERLGPVLERALSGQGD
ncbi:MAG TPA: Maf family protein [Fimbriimonadaceae bacterium]|nr:Maf family protein [Fimbriimonadaceae bacterium]